MTTISLHVKFAWWVLPYLAAIEMFSLFTGMTPDSNKVAATVLRGTRVSVVTP
jgi:hypothetical protein